MHRRRSRRVFGGGRYAALGEEFTHQVQAGEICPHELLDLRAGQEHEPSRCLRQGEHRSLRKPGSLSQVGRYDQSPPVTHRYLIRPTHEGEYHLYESYGAETSGPFLEHRQSLAPLGLLRRWMRDTDRHVSRDGAGQRTSRLRYGVAGWPMRSSETVHSRCAAPGSIAHCLTPWLFSNKSASFGTVWASRASSR
jgi:hypothetical protein